MQIRQSEHNESWGEIASNRFIFRTYHLKQENGFCVACTWAERMQFSSVGSDETWFTSKL